MGGKQLKKKVFELLNDKDFEKGIFKISGFSARAVVNPLFSFFYNNDELIKWHAVTAMGVVVSSLADNDMESARVVMRRLIWNLNDESGGIGWGSPEAMGEIMARHEGLAKEYHKMLLSYMMPDGNYIEHEILQRGVLWGVGRLAHSRPHLVKDFASFLVLYMISKDAMLRGLSAWAAGPLDNKVTESSLKNLAYDNEKIRFFSDKHFVDCTVGSLAAEALSENYNI